jgi:hypothetical protein
MSINDCKEEKKPTLKLFKEDEEENVIEDNKNCFLYCDKNNCLYDDFFLKQNDTKEDKHKSSIDLNLTDKNLHEFLNNDLIKALDNDLNEPEDLEEASDSNSANANGNSEFTSNASSPEPEIKFPKNVKNIDMNLNAEKEQDEKDSINVNNLSVNFKKIDNKLNKTNEHNSNINNSINNVNVNKIDNLDNIKDDINILNDPLFAPLYFPKTMRNKFEEIKQEDKEINEQNILDNKGEKKNNSIRNKFDDDVEPIVMMPIMNKEEKTKLPFEIRVGDWICLYCNNLNFSFRIKCNRCGLLRKSTNYLLKQKYNMNYQYMNCNNFNDGYNTNVNYNGDYNLYQNINNNIDLY